jgi:putative membrane protein
MTFLVKILINAAALWVATQFVSGITFQGDWVRLLGVALVFGLVNAIVRPIVKLLTFPLLILTLGLFTLVINGLMLMLTSALSGALDLGLRVSGFWPAFWGALVISIVSFLLSVVIPDREAR